MIPSVFFCSHPGCGYVSYDSADATRHRSRSHRRCPDCNARLEWMGDGLRCVECGELWDLAPFIAGGSAVRG